jgi:hypothetical protein
MLAEPFDKLGVGVKVAVRVSPVLLIALKVPPEIIRSPAVPSLEKLVTGSSENAKEMVAVSPTFRAAKSEVIVTVGASVSIVIEGDVPAEPVLPAASE